MTNEAITFIRPATLSNQVPYAYAAVIDAARTLWTAGACPLDAEGRTVAEGDAVRQAEQVMINLAATLAEVGSQLSDVVKSTVYVASSRREDLTAVWGVVRSAFGDHDAPSTLLGVSALGWPGQLVEVEAVAILPPGRADVDPSAPPTPGKSASS
ncbi:RidA family protein [Kineococcus esterisolvens]|uniref:RidA family protein n=1 Tax=unclassified Kineococcus TaxID=2621656 RepID=UPI003D7D6953